MSPGQIFTTQHPCEHSRINILQWIFKLSTYLVLKRIWNPIDFQGQRSRSVGQIFRRGDTPHFALPLLIFDVVLFQSQFTHDIPDGHKAPCPDLINRGSSTRSVDTQTPGNLSDNSSGSRSHSVSPAIPIMPGHVDTSRPSSDSSPRRPSSDSSPRRPSSDYSPREMEKGIVFLSC
jgi:hypothetical protein